MKRFLAAVALMAALVLGGLGFGRTAEAGEDWATASVITTTGGTATSASNGNTYGRR